MKNLMIFPAKENRDIKLVQYPNDYDSREIYRHVTGLIADMEQNQDECQWEDIAALLEDHGFVILDYVLGPELCEK